MELRTKLGLRGQVDAEAVANLLGLTVVPLQLEELQELMVDDCIGVADRLAPAWRRWVIAHAVGHKVLHPGNHLWMRMHTGLAGKVEREAEDFAQALLLDATEVVGEGLSEAWEIAENFGVPEELVLLQAPLFFEGYEGELQC
ncbi:MAG: ImmA/IrrE family metallo-endopeptidase [Chloroflexi bacterium]|nr:ImmA/IrrE family metallo-endopeptidase [Chloroflexota bacterium]